MKRDYKKIVQNIDRKKIGSLLLKIIIVILFAVTCYFIYYYTMANKINDNISYSAVRTKVEDILVIDDSYFYTKTGDNGFYYLYDENNNLVSDDYYLSVFIWFQIDDIIYFNIEETNGYGVINSNGEVIIPSLYSKISCSKEYNVCTCLNSQEEALYDLEGNKLFSKTNEHYYYDYYDEYSEEIDLEFTSKYSVYLSEGKVGIIDNRGNTIIDAKYEIEENKENDYYIIYEYLTDVICKTSSNNYYFILKQDNKYGVVDKNENIILDFIYDSILFDSNFNLFITSIDDNTVIYDESNKEVYTFTDFFTPVAIYTDVSLDENNKYTTLSLSDGTSFAYDKDFNLVNGIITEVGKTTYILYKDNVPILYDTNNMVIYEGDEDTILTYIYSNDDDRVLVCKTQNDFECALMNSNGKFLTDYYDDIYNLDTSDSDNSNLVIVKDNACGILDIDGNEIIGLNDAYSKESGCTYTYLTEGYYKVIGLSNTENNNMGVVNKNNNQVIYNEDIVYIDYVNKNLIYATTSDYKTIIYNLNGTVLSTEIEETDTLDSFLLEKNKKYIFSGSDLEGNTYLYVLSKS